MWKLLTLLYICLIISFINAYGFALCDIILAIRGRKFKVKLTKSPVRSIHKVYLVVPSMNERRVISRCFYHLLEVVRKARLIWPEITYQLVFIDDASTDGTAAKLDSISRQYPSLVYVIHRRLPNAQRGKGMALNNALRWIDAQHDNPEQTILGVIDSDSTPEADFLLPIIETFEHTHFGLLQNAVLINNASSFLTKMQRFEFYVPNFLAQLRRTYLGSGLASGNGQFMILKMANHVRWRNSLLDDLEFSINGLLRGFYGSFLPSDYIPQEGVLKYTKLIRQRVRWCQGGMQCLYRYTKPLIKSSKISLYYKINLIIGMVLPFFSLIAEPCSLISFLLIIYYFILNPLVTLLPIILIILINVLVTLIMIFSTKYVGHRSFYQVTGHHSLEVVMGNLIYNWLLAPVPYIALFRLLTRRNNWMKTSHKNGNE